MMSDSKVANVNGSIPTDAVAVAPTQEHSNTKAFIVPSTGTLSAAFQVSN